MCGEGGGGGVGGRGCGRGGKKHVSDLKLKIMNPVNIVTIY